MSALCSAAPHQLQTDDTGTSILSNATPQPKFSPIQIHQKREGALEDEADNHRHDKYTEKILAYLGLGRPTPDMLLRPKHGEQLLTWSISDQDNLDDDQKVKAVAQAWPASDTKTSGVISFPHPDVDNDEESKSKKGGTFVQAVLELLQELIPSNKEALQKHKEQINKKEEKQAEKNCPLANQADEEKEKSKAALTAASTILAPGPLIPKTDGFPKVEPKKAAEKKPEDLGKPQSKTEAPGPTPSNSV